MIYMVERRLLSIHCKYLRHTWYIRHKCLSCTAISRWTTVVIIDQYVRMCKSFKSLRAEKKRLALLTRPLVYKTAGYTGVLFRWVIYYTDCEH